MHSRRMVFLGGTRCESELDAGVWYVAVDCGKSDKSRHVGVEASVSAFCVDFGESRADE